MKVPALRRLVQQGQVSRTGRGGKGDPYRYQANPGGSEAEREEIPRRRTLISPPTALSQDSCSLFHIYQGTRKTRIRNDANRQSCGSGFLFPGFDPPRRWRNPLFRVAGTSISGSAGGGGRLRGRPLGRVPPAPLGRRVTLLALLDALRARWVTLEPAGDGSGSVPRTP